MSSPVKLGIVGLGRWAKVLTRAVRGKSGKLDIVAGFSRSQARRDEFHKELGVPPAASMEALLANPDIKGVILTVPNEQHWPLAEMAAKAGKHVYTEKPIAQTLEDGLRIAALESKYNITVTVGHSARLMAGIRIIKEHIDRGDLGRVAFMEANFSNERALELTPQTWRWYKDRAPGGNLSQLCIHLFDVLHLQQSIRIHVSAPQIDLDHPLIGKPEVIQDDRPTRIVVDRQLDVGEHPVGVRVRHE